jgi:hypothetical protein
VSTPPGLSTAVRVTSIVVWGPAAAGRMGTNSCSRQAGRARVFPSPRVSSFRCRSGPVCLAHVRPILCSSGSRVPGPPTVRLEPLEPMALGRSGKLNVRGHSQPQLQLCGWLQSTGLWRTASVTTAPGVSNVQVKVKRFVQGTLNGGSEYGVRGCPSLTDEGF